MIVMGYQPIIVVLQTVENGPDLENDRVQLYYFILYYFVFFETVDTGHRYQTKYLGLADLDFDRPIELEKTGEQRIRVKGCCSSICLTSEEKSFILLKTLMSE